MATPNSSDTDRTPTSVYRYYDRARLLIYVGVTARGAHRNAEHNAGKEWWSYVRSQEVDHYPTRAAALAAEKRLITQYRPPFNKQHNPGSDEIRSIYIAWRESTKDGTTQLAEMLRVTKRRVLLHRDGQQFVSGPEMTPLVWAIKGDKFDLPMASSRGRVLVSKQGDRLVASVAGKRHADVTLINVRVKFADQTQRALRVMSVGVGDE